MADKDRPLPRPPKTPFGRKTAGTEEEKLDLLADRMAEAAVQGRLNEFLGTELPDSEHARALAKMMMGMTGMLPQEGAAPSPPSAETPQQTGSTGETPVPDEIRRAVQEGNVQGLMGLLREEYRKRTGNEPPAAEAPAVAAPASEEMPPEERETMEKLLEIARQNKVSLDWVVLRALKLYIEEYKKTGRL
jgi:hypothetical protein